MSKEREEFLEANEKFKAAINTPTPNEEVRARMFDAIDKARNTLKVAQTFCEDRLRELSNPK